MLNEYPEYTEKKPEIIRNYKIAERKPVFEDIPVTYDKEKKNEPDLSGLNDIQKQIYKCIADGNNHIDMMVRELGMPSGKLNNELLMMELEGIIKGYPGNKYGIN